MNDETKSLSNDDFIDPKIEWDSDNIEICGIRSTCQDNVLQILAIENEKKVFVIVTWDFYTNIEISIF